MTTTVSTKPYLIRALHEWCVDQGFTPHIAVVVDRNVMIPPGYDRDGQIVLNLSPEATHQLHIDNEAIAFQARFGGQPHHLYIPVGNVLAIYAAENGHGMAFEPELGQGEEDEGLEGQDPEAGAPPALQVVDASGAGSEEAGSSVPAGGGDDESPSEPPPRRSHLKVVK